MLHVTDIQKYLNCPYSYYYSLKEEKNRSYMPFAQSKESLSSLIIHKMKLDNVFIGQTGDSMERTLKAMESYDAILYGRFEMDTLRTNIPLLLKKDDKWDVYFARLEIYPHDTQTQYLADSLWPLKELKIPLGEYYYIHLNQEYLFHDHLDYDNVLRISEHFYNSHNRPSVFIKDAVEKKSRNLRYIIEDMISMEPSHFPLKKRNSACTRGYKCNYYDYCWTNEAKEPDNSILNLVSSQHKYQMYDNGIKTLKEADTDLIEGSHLQYAQIMADRNNGLYYDHLALQHFVKDCISFPLSFVDFEWDLFAVPEYEGLHPFDVSLWQYSLHVLDTPDGKLQHYEFIGEKDCRKELLESLLTNLPKTGSIATYNGIGAEEIRMRELAVYYPEYKKEINDVLSRMIDFSLPFTNGQIYHTRMKGSYSLKSIVEIFGEENSYQNLDISKAVNAVGRWRELCEINDSKEKEAILEELSAYCGMDTYSLYLIYKWFVELTGKEEECQASRHTI